jgi:CRP-like cAMP-binding protein
VSPSGPAAGAVAQSVLSSTRDPSRMGRDWVPALESVPLFYGLSKRHLRRIAELGRTKRYAPGAPIVRAGSPGTSFYVILDGDVRVLPPGGRASRLRRGDSFGEMALLDRAPRSADVVADGEVLTMTIGSAGFAKLLRREPQLSNALLRTLARRLRAAERLL